MTCSQNYVHAAVPPMTTDTFVRLTVHQDFSRREFAVFLDGALLLDSQPFVSGGSAYSSFQVHNASGTAYLDDVRITTTLPDWMTVDLNGNGVPDAYEIQQFGSLRVTGVIYLFR